LGDFGNCKGRAGGKKGYCKRCSARENAPYARKYSRGIGDRELAALWERQERQCAICKEGIPIHLGKFFRIDKDPATLEVRGLLCPKCGRGMAGFQGNQVLLSAAAKYLRRFEAERRERRRNGIKAVCSSPASPPPRTGGNSGPVP